MWWFSPDVCALCGVWLPASSAATEEPAHLLEPRRNVAGSLRLRLPRRNEASLSPALLFPRVCFLVSPESKDAFWVRQLTTWRTLQKKLIGAIDLLHSE